MWDWLFNLMLPGKIYRHEIMACLVYCSPPVQSLGAAPFYDNGLIVKGASYWPNRKTLGRVLGGLKDIKSVAGWIGPVPALSGDKTGWIRLTAREATMPVPVKSNTGQSTLNNLGFDENGMMDRYTFLESLLNPNEWVTMAAPERPAGDNSRTQSHQSNRTSSGRGNPRYCPRSAPETYRATVEFNLNSASVTYTLYKNPVFVAAQPCVGAHIIHKKERERYQQNVIRVQDLKKANPSPNDVVVIDALGPNEDAVARAWCAERGRCAIVRRGNECCFTCTVCLAIGRKGLGFNVIILSRV
ncbi:hypothetical protein BDW69DRAFT_149007 [Aspergillus filifer]